MPDPLAQSLVAAYPDVWAAGMLTHTTHASSGCLPVPVGTPIRYEGRGFGDDVVEGRFGPIVHEPSHRHPDFGALCEAHDRSMREAWARVLPDLDDPATAGILLARLHAVNLARGRGAVSVLMFRTFVEVHVGPGEMFSGPTLGHACAAALVALAAPPTE